MHFLEKWQLANKFFVRKVNCDGNTLLSAKKRVEEFNFFKNQPCTCYKLCSCKLIIVSNILKAKESPCTTFESQDQPARIYREAYTDKHDHTISWNKDLLSQVGWLRKKTSVFSTF